MNQRRTETVVLVPGMYSPRLTMQPLASRLRKHGYKTLVFSNRYLLRTPLQNGQRLVAFLKATPGDTIHLVGHSLGGVVILHALKLNADAPPADQFAGGKVVLIGSPVRGNALARKLVARPMVGWILGRSVKDGLLGPSPDELNHRDTGVICGSSPRGLAALVYKPTETNDGLVMLSETRLDQAKDSVCIPQSHALMLFSKLSTDLTLQFLQHGRFVAK